MEKLLPTLRGKLEVKKMVSWFSIVAYFDPLSTESPVHWGVTSNVHTDKCWIPGGVVEGEEKTGVEEEEETGVVEGIMSIGVLDEEEVMTGVLEDEEKTGVLDDEEMTGEEEEEEITGVLEENDVSEILEEVGLLQVQYGSTRHSELQPSPEIEFPSSQVSPGSRTPLPHNSTVGTGVEVMIGVEEEEEEMTGVLEDEEEMTGVEEEEEMTGVEEEEDEMTGVLEVNEDSEGALSEQVRGTSEHMTRRCHTSVFLPHTAATLVCMLVAPTIPVHCSRAPRT